MDFSESSEKVLADADFRSFGITRDAVDFRSNITFSSFHLYTVLGHVTAGNYVDSNKAIYWDGRSENGEMVSSGSYFYQMMNS